MEFKPKYLKATVTIQLPAVEADASIFGVYKLTEMAAEYQKRLENNTLAELETAEILDENDLIVVTAKVEVKDTQD